MTPFLLEPNRDEINHQEIDPYRVCSNHPFNGWF